MSDRVILDLCSGSGNWSAYYRELGYKVVRVEISDGVDVRLLPYQGRVAGILAAPPCTVFANSGARWPRTERDMLDALSVVDACLRMVVVCQPDWWALENPVGKLRRWLGPPCMWFNPCDYGDPYTKKTGLWGNFNPPIPNPVEPVLGSKIHRLSSSAKYERSLTPLGFARAFTEANP